MKRDIKLEAFYPWPVETVWRALTDSEALAEWLMPNDFSPRVGHKFQFRTKPAPGFDGIVNCEVIELIEHERLAFTWKGGGINTVVTFTLEPDPNGTRLRLEHNGFEGLRAVLVSFILGGGWRKKILPLHLPAALARLSGKEMGTASQPKVC
jgi:uncharacterized protein YndB with AHSA1/START domain